MYRHIDFFKDKDLTISWKTPFDDEHHLEVNGDKGRVYSNSFLTKGKPSKYRKIKLVKELKNDNKSIFRLIVNKQVTYFKAAINLKSL